MPDPAVLLLAGPTAVGKSERAVQLAETLGGEIISADARQIYRRLDVGTAKPTPEQLRRIPHHLIDIIDPDESYSAARFARDAGRLLAEIGRRGHHALVVGGTGLYFRALTEGLFRAPDIGPEVRKEADALFRQGGREALRDYLQAHDTQTLSIIDPLNTARLRRAVEYHLQTGGSLAADRTESPTDPGGHRWYPVLLERSRPELHMRIEKRLNLMLQGGWRQEVRNLMKEYDFTLPAFGAVGYRELESVESKRLSLEEATARILARTRQYAKRQITWFQHQGAWRPVSAESGVTAKIASGFEKFAENKSA